MPSSIDQAIAVRAGEQCRWSGLHGSALALRLVEAASVRPRPLLVITTDSQNAERLALEARFYAGDEGPPIRHLPDWETLPYDVFSPHQEIVSQRLETLYELPGLASALVIIPANTLLQRLPPVRFIEGRTLVLRSGDRLSLEQMRQRLQAAGYRYVPQVQEHGEFSVRGALLDVYPMGADAPLRIDLFDDEVDTLRTFDPETQLSTERIDAIRLLPGSELPFDEEGIKTFRRRYRACIEGNPQNSLIYRDVSAGISPGGIEYYLPLFFEETASVSDYLPDGTLLVYDQGAQEAIEATWRQINERYQQRRHDIERPLLSPEQAFFPPPALQETLQSLPTIGVTGQRGDHDFDSRPPPDLRLEPRRREPARALASFIDAFPGRVLLAAESPGRREALIEILTDHGLRPRTVADWAAFMTSEAELAVTVAPLERGLLDGEIAVIAEPQLYGERAPQRQRRRAARDPAAIIRDLTDLNPGSPVVHEAHGVGRYLGLERIKAGGTENEFLALEYAGGDKLFVPVSSLHLISRYTGVDPEHAPLHRLGSDQWERARRRAARRARDAAAELLEIQARRAAAGGQALTFDEDDYRAFAGAFAFEETPDQRAAIDAVLADLRAPRAMDRVVCGDVGFGKTEVAMRATFAAVSGGRQVAILVPTTLLAQQHLQNFRDRFADWPVRIESLSRMRSQKQQKAVLAGLADGSVDIVIGTHKLLQETARFKRLGLVVVDEEHRFGVRHKEQLKRLRAEVDLLTLTATPIPRTLNMSLAGLRDLSIIATPPSERLAIKTFVGEWNEAVIRESCLREIKRGGQVYFLHNDIDSIERIAAELRRLVPEAHVDVAHGQMPERELERVMLDFYHRRFNILVCTTIIESGIDIPTANTIVINRADRFGLAQLHQLRGRVGRSHHRAYAYLLAPPRTVLTADAVKRLEAIESMEDLGSGFTLATHDMEIRGAGELLGEEQSGQIQEVGFSLYSDLLERAIEALRRGELPAPDQEPEYGTEVDLRIPALLPSTYVPDVHLRLILYKRIASARDEQELHALQVEMIDRFGLLPEEAKALFALSRLRLHAMRLGIRKLEAGGESGRLLFRDRPGIDADALIALLQSDSDRYRMEGQHTLRFYLSMPEPQHRIEAVSALLRQLSPTDKDDEEPQTMKQATG